MHLTCASEWAALKLGSATANVQDLLVKVLTPSRSIKFKRSNLTLIPDVVSYSTAISACEKGKRWQEALQLLLEMLQEMLHRSLTPNVVSHSAAISACEKGKHWEEALCLLREVPHRSLTPDVISSSAAIEGCGGVGQ